MEGQRKERSVRPVPDMYREQQIRLVKMKYHHIEFSSHGDCHSVWMVFGAC